MGIPWESKSVKLQDDWNLDEGEGGIERKWDAILNFLAQTNSGAEDVLYLNHISAAKKGAGPCALAKGNDGDLQRVEGLNSRLDRHLKTIYGHRVGIVIMDFPGCWLIWSILSLNFNEELQ